MKIKNINVKVENKQILQNISLEIKPGELVVLKGKNGSGKSTLATEIVKKNKDVFLGFQTPVAIPGVTYLDLLRLASKTKLGPLEFYQFLKEKAKILKVSEEFLNRNINENLSGGEKKKMELFQALVLSPKYAILDEPDSGVDSANLKLIVKGVKLLLKQGTGILLITHNPQIFGKARQLILDNGRLN